MQKTKLTRRQKLLLSIRGLKPENWYFERETYKCKGGGT